MSAADMSAPDRARLRELLEEADSLPWRARTRPMARGGYATEVVRPFDEAVVANAAEENAALIAEAVNALPALLDALDEAEKSLTRIRAVVDAQAEDEGLWGIYPFGEQPIVEAYLQQELRRLHEVIEGVTQEAAARDALRRIGAK